jgi:hypothetical protein
MRGVFTGALPSTLTLTTDGITFSSIGARLGSCVELADEDAVSAASAEETGAIAIPILNANALRNKLDFFIFQDLLKLLWQPK